MEARRGEANMESGKPAETTTFMVQRYLLDLQRGENDDCVIRVLLDRAVHRVRSLCGSLLHRHYSRLTRPPVNLNTDELLGAVVQRLINAMHKTRPEHVRQFFALVNYHIRWELNDLVRRLDRQPRAEVLPLNVPAPNDADSLQRASVLRVFEEIERLPDEERETFELIHIQGLTHAEVAEVVGVATKTVQRRLNRALLLLAERLYDLQRIEPPSGGFENGS